MRKPKNEDVDDSGEFPFMHDDDEFEERYLDMQDLERDRGASPRKLPARQRLELRNEQRSLRRQLSDWDDYDDDFESSL